MKMSPEINSSLEIDKSKFKKFRFDQIAFSISERVEPQNTDLEIYYGLEHLDSNSIHLTRNGVPTDVEGTKLRVYPGDIIFGKRRAYQRKAAICKVDAICSAHAMVLRANPKVIYPKLFPFFLHSDLFMNRAIDISVGSLSPTINWGTLKEQEFSLPPIDQQEKLAELLWAGDLNLQNKETLLDRIELIEAIQRKDYFIKSENSTPLGNHIKLRKGKKPSTLLPKANGLMPYLSAEYCRNSDSETFFVDVKSESNVLVVSDDEILILWDGSNAGEIFFSKNGVVSSTIAHIQLISTQIKKEYLYLLLLASQPKIKSGNNGSAIPHVSGETLLNIPVPSISINEQEAIINKFKIIDLNKSILKESILNLQIVNTVIRNMIF